MDLEILVGRLVKYDETVRSYFDERISNENPSDGNGYRGVLVSYLNSSVSNTEAPYILHMLDIAVLPEGCHDPDHQDQEWK